MAVSSFVGVMEGVFRKMRQNVRISGQGSGKAVDVGIRPFLDNFVIVLMVAVCCHLLVAGETMLAEGGGGGGGEAAGLIGICVGVIGDIIFQVNKDHHDAM